MSESRANLVASARTAERIRRFPELGLFVDTTSPYCAAADTEQFWCCEKAFRALLRSSFLGRLVRDELQRVAVDPAYIPASGLSRYDFGIAITDTFSLSVELFIPGVKLSARLYAPTEHCFVGVADFLGAGSARYELFEQPDPWPNEVLDRRKKLVPRGIHTVSPGSVVSMRAAVDVPRLLPMDAPVILLIFGSRNIVPLRWEYDEHLTAIRAMGAMLTPSRLEYATRLLAELGHRESIEPLKGLLSHPDHFVRWAAIRAVMRIDFDEGIGLLQHAGRDPHPHVRNAAYAAFDRLMREGRLAGSSSSASGGAA